MWSVLRFLTTQYSVETSSETRHQEFIVTGKTYTHSYHDNSLSQKVGKCYVSYCYLTVVVLWPASSCEGDGACPPGWLLAPFRILVMAGNRGKFILDRQEDCCA